MTSAEDFSRLNTIRPHDLTELKVLHNPPFCVVRVVKAVFILLGYDPNDLDWRQCKMLLNQKGGTYFLNTIAHFEASMSSEKAINSAIKELQDLDMEIVLANSAALAGLFIWCLKVILE